MDITEALEIVVGRTRHERYRELCDPAHPDYDPAYVALVIKLATEGVPERHFISKSSQCGCNASSNLATALAKVDPERRARIEARLADRRRKALGGSA